MLQDGLCGLASWRKPSGFEVTFKPSFPFLPWEVQHVAGITAHCFGSGALAHTVNTFWDALAASTVRARKVFGAWSREGTRGEADSLAAAGSVLALM